MPTPLLRAIFFTRKLLRPNFGSESSFVYRQDWFIVSLFGEEVDGSLFTPRKLEGVDGRRRVVEVSPPLAGTARCLNSSTSERQKSEHAPKRQYAYKGGWMRSHNVNLQVSIHDTCRSMIW